MKLLSGGCSLIYGSELQDETPGVGNFSLSTYPALVAKKLNMEYDCAARPGYGSDAMVRQIIARMDDSVHMVVVCWTYFDRFEFHFADMGWQNIRWQPGEGDTIETPERLANYRREFYGNLTEVYSRYCYLRDVIFLQNFLHERQIPYVFSSAKEDFLDRDQFQDLGVEHGKLYDQIDFSRWFFWPGTKTFLSWCQDQRLPMGRYGHPLELAHDRTAELVLDHLKTQGIAT